MFVTKIKTNKRTWETISSSIENATYDIRYFIEDELGYQEEVKEVLIK